MVFGIIQVLYKSPTPYWAYLKAPVFLFYVLAVSRFIIMNKQLTANINAVEKFCNRQ